MNIVTINDHRIDVPADMQIHFAIHAVGGDNDEIQYRGYSICTAYTDDEPVHALYVGPFFILTQSSAFEPVEVANLAEARRVIDELSN